MIDNEPKKSKRRSALIRKMSESNLLYVIVDILQNSDTPQYIKNSLLKITALHNNKV